MPSQPASTTANSIRDAEVKLILCLAGSLLFLAGCQMPRPLYYWGNYETVSYLSYSKPEKATLQVQQAKLEEDLQKAKGHNMAAHPGLHAQLGYVYYQLGLLDEAVREFTAEKSLFPESATFMDQMIQRTKGGTAK